MDSNKPKSIGGSDATPQPKTSEGRPRSSSGAQAQAKNDDKRKSIAREDKDTPGSFRRSRLGSIKEGSTRGSTTTRRHEADRRSEAVQSGTEDNEEDTVDFNFYNANGINPAGEAYSRDVLLAMAPSNMAIPRRLMQHLDRLGVLSNSQRKKEHRDSVKATRLSSAAPVVLQTLQREDRKMAYMSKSLESHTGKRLSEAVDRRESLHDHGDNDSVDCELVSLADVVHDLKKLFETKASASVQELKQLVTNARKRAPGEKLELTPDEATLASQSSSALAQQLLQFQTELNELKAQRAAELDKGREQLEALKEHLREQQAALTQQLSDAKEELADRSLQLTSVVRQNAKLQARLSLVGEKNLAITHELELLRSADPEAAARAATAAAATLGHAVAMTVPVPEAGSSDEDEAAVEAARQAVEKAKKSSDLYRPFPGLPPGSYHPRGANYHAYCPDPMQIPPQDTAPLHHLPLSPGSELPLGGPPLGGLPLSPSGEPHATFPFAPAIPGVSPAEVPSDLVMTCKTFYGSHYIQQQLESEWTSVTGGERGLEEAVVASVHGPRPFFTQFFSQVRERVFEVMTNKFGRFSFEKMLGQCTDEERVALLRNLTPNLAAVACDTHGSFGTQVLVRSLQQPEHLDVIADALRSDMLALMMDYKGHYLAVVLITQFPYDNFRFIDEVLLANCTLVSTNNQGLQVIKALFKTRTTAQLLPLLKVIAGHTMDLCEDQYGNYVVQQALLKCHYDKPGQDPSEGDASVSKQAGEVKEMIMRPMQGHFRRLAQLKFSSNVVELCLKHAISPHWVAVMVRELVADPPTHVKNLVNDRYGNYVLQSALSTADRKQVATIAERLSPHLVSFRSNLRAKWTNLIQQAQERVRKGEQAHTRQPAAKAPKVPVAVPPNPKQPAKPVPQPPVTLHQFPEFHRASLVGHSWGSICQ